MKRKGEWPNPHTSWSILWGDKTVLTAPSATALIDRLGALQWEPCPRQVMRARLVDRAHAWTGVEIDEATSDEQFLRDLEGAGMFTLYEPTVYNDVTTTNRGRKA